MVSITVLLLGGFLSFPTTVATDTATLEIREWQVPWEGTRPRDPFVDAKGRVCFVGQRGDYAAYLVPASGEFKRYDLEPDTGPHNLVVDDDGLVWYAGNRAAHIGRLDPETGAIEKHPMPNPEARDPHTLVFDRQGHIWFTVQGGNFVGKLEKATGRIQLIPVPTPGARPYGIVVDARNRPWIAEFGTNKIAVVNPDTMKLEELELPPKDARPRRLDVLSDGSVWYVDYAEGYLGRFDPVTAKIEEWPVPGGTDARPYGIAADDADRLWFVETGLDPNRFVGFDPRTKSFFSTAEIGSGGGSVRHVFFGSANRRIWFGTDVNPIGRAQIPAPEP